MPSIFYTCSYLQNAFTSPVAYTNTVTTLLGTSYSNLANQFAQCFGGTNDFMLYVNPTLNGYLSQLKTSVFTSYQYNFTSLTATLNSDVSAIGTLIDNTGLGHIPDFDVTTANGAAEI